ncbi:replication-relaxation family protein [Aliiruegeria lutimaris]|nr:replication-relaxation family protein [Aliiruegeria lutimaris]
MKPQTDSLGRATFHHIAPRAGVRPTEREIRWLKHIERHGPQSSLFLYELTRDTHRCCDTALRDLQKLRAGGFLRLPSQQRQVAKAEFNPYIYDLTRLAKDHLGDLGLDEPAVRPSGHWWHGYAVSSVTSAIDIAAARAGVRYIPAHEILAIRGADLAIPLGRTTLIPDQLFALDYGGRYRAFALEVDRGTEPLRSTAARKSLQKSIEQYRRLIEQGIYKQHYGLKANLIVLWVFESERRHRQFLEMLRGVPATVSQAMLSRALGGSGRDVRGAGALIDLYASPWERANRGAVCLALESEP